MCTACWWCTALWSVVNAAPSLQALWVWVAYDLNCVKYLPKLGKQNVHKPVVQQNTTQYSLHNVSRVFEITSFCELIWLIVEWVTRTHTSYYFIVSIQWYRHSIVNILYYNENTRDTTFGQTSLSFPSHFEVRFELYSRFWQRERVYSTCTPGRSLDYN